MTTHQPGSTYCTCNCEGNRVLIIVRNVCCSVTSYTYMCSCWGYPSWWLWHSCYQPRTPRYSISLPSVYHLSPVGLWSMYIPKDCQNLRAHSHSHYVCARSLYIATPLLACIIAFGMQNVVQTRHRSWFWDTHNHASIKNTPTSCSPEFMHEVVYGNVIPAKTSTHKCGDPFPAGYLCSSACKTHMAGMRNWKMFCLPLKVGPPFNQGY